MNKKLQCLAAAIMAAASLLGTTVPSDTPGFVQFISDQGAVSRKDSATPGQLYATERYDAASNKVVSLSIGTPSGQRVPIADPYAFRRRVMEYVDYPDFYIECGTNNFLTGEYTVRTFNNVVIPGQGMSDTDPSYVRKWYTQTFRVKPLNGRWLLDCKVRKDETSATGSSLMNNNFGTVTITALNGELYVEVKFHDFASSDLTVTKCDVTIYDVKATTAWQNENAIRDDLTESVADFHFIDEDGATSLGKIRKWVHREYDDYKADRWATFPATDTVMLKGNTTHFTRQSYIFTESMVNTNDTQTWRVGGTAKVAMRVGGDNSGQGQSEFSILQIDCNTDSDYTFIYTTNDEDSPYCLCCDDMATGLWYYPEGQSTTLSTYNGETAWKITVPNSGKRTQFFRAVSEGGAATQAYLYSAIPYYNDAGVVLKASNNTWWKLQVSPTGVLSTTNITAVVPTGVGVR